MYKTIPKLKKTTYALCLEMLLSMRMQQLICTAAIILLIPTAQCASYNRKTTRCKYMYIKCVCLHTCSSKQAIVFPDTIDDTILRISRNTILRPLPATITQYI